MPSQPVCFSQGNFFVRRKREGGRGGGGGGGGLVDLEVHAQGFLFAFVKELFWADFASNLHLFVNFSLFYANIHRAFMLVIIAKKILFWGEGE